MEQPGFDGVDDSCDGVDRYTGTNGRAFHAIFVDAGRNASNDGKSPQSPTPDLTAAIQTARSASWCRSKSVDGKNIPCDVYVSKRTNTLGETVLGNRQHVYGGFDSTKWSQSSWTPGGASRTSKTTITLKAPSSGRLATFVGSSITEDGGLSGLEIEAADATRDGQHSVGFWCDRCSALWLDNISFAAGKGGEGKDGSDAPYASKQYTGNWGTSCIDSTPSGYDSAFHSGFNPTGNSGVGGGQHKSYDKSTGYYFFRAAGGSKGQDGDDGGYLMSRADGAGRGKISGSGGLSFVDEPADDGTFNDGGGGGGAEDLQNYPSNHIPGGSGGCPGHGGRKGASGGYSIGLALIDSQGMHMNGVSVQADSAGNGGDGGVGGKGSPGTLGFSQLDPMTYREVSAGDGGDGAGGDGGGGGAGGHSIGCLLLDHTIGSGNFDKAKNCTASTPGAAGKGGKGGSSPGRDGRDGGDGPKGLNCNSYSVPNFSSSHDFQSSCQ